MERAPRAKDKSDLRAGAGHETAASAERLRLTPDAVTRLKNRVRHRLQHEVAPLREELQ